MKRTRYAVEYEGARVARFSDHDDAQAFAASRQSADVFAPDGIVGQWRQGAPTPEFQHLKPA